jgi:hypothetical protein
MSAAEEFYRTKGQPRHAPIFDYVFWDVLWVAIINVPLYMTLGLIWWSVARARQRRAA